jgi:hypothetical protein
MAKTSHERDMVTHTHTHTHTHTYTQADTQTDRQTDRQEHRLPDWQAELIGQSGTHSAQEEGG